MNAAWKTANGTTSIIEKKPHHCLYVAYKDQMGHVARKPVFGVSVKASFKPFSSATGTSYKIEFFARSKSRYDTFQLANNKGVDQTARMRRLVSGFVVRNH